MPHRGDEAHLWRAQREVLREGQFGLEDSSFTATRGEVRSDWTQGTRELSLECVGWSESVSDGKTTGEYRR